MIQQLENAFLAILRLVILIAACVTLAATVILGISALPAIFPEPAPPEIQPHVKLDTIVERHFSVKPKIQQPALRSFSFDTSTPVHIPDPLCVSLSDVIANFVSAYGDDASVTKEDVTQFLENIIERRPRAYRDAFKHNLATYVHQLVSNEHVIIHATATSPISVVNKAISSFVADFDQQIEEIQEQAERARSRHRQAKADAMQRLIMAGFALVSLLSILFLMVFIRIERNLRPLQALSARTEQPVSHTSGGHLS